MQYSLFLMPFLSSFAIASFLLFVFVKISSKKKIQEIRKDIRHTHKYGVSRLGGVAIIISFLLAIFWDSRLVIETPLKVIVIAILMILVFGLVDDLKEINWKWQLLFQISLVLFLFFTGVRLEFITNPLGGIIFLNTGMAYYFGLFLSLVWIIFLMNAMNWIDGIDGASGGITLIAAASIFILSLRPDVNQPPIAIITAALFGSLAAFLIFNFHPAKIMAGTSGSMFMGFILAVLAIFAGAKIATTLMVLVLPVIDAIWVIAKRIGLKKSIFNADRNHLHFRLLEFGWSVKNIFYFFCCLTVLIAFIALNMKAIGKLSAFLFIVVILFAMFFYIDKKVLLRKNNEQEK